MHLKELIKPTEVDMIAIRSCLSINSILWKYYLSDSDFYPVVYYDLDDLKFEYYQRIIPYNIFTLDIISYYAIYYPGLVNDEVNRLTAKRQQHKLFNCWVKFKLWSELMTDSIYPKNWEFIVFKVNEARQQYAIDADEILRIYPDGYPKI